VTGRSTDPIHQRFWTALLKRRQYFIAMSPMLYDYRHITKRSTGEFAMAAASDPVVILSAARTALGRVMGELSPLSAHELGSRVIGSALERAKLASERIDEVFMGNVLPAGQG